MGTQAQWPVIAGKRNDLCFSGSCPENEQDSSILLTRSGLNNAQDEEIETGAVAIENVGGRSTAVRCFSKYPLKFILPRKVGSSKTDAVWIYTLTYGGGIVSGDRISCKLSLGSSCTAVLTTQASTKVYKSVGSKCSGQKLEARVGSNAFLAIFPDPVTCFSTARYFQKQVFRVSSDSSLAIVDWVTSGRHESGEKWDFNLYRSTNNIFLEDDQPLLLDTILLDKEKVGCVEGYMQDYQVIAMIVLLGPKVQHVQNLVQDDVKRIMSEQLLHPSTTSSHQTKRNSDYRMSKPSFVASCSFFGPKRDGLIVRVAAVTTESVYKFLQHQLASLEPVLGMPPYG